MPVWAIIVIAAVVVIILLGLIFALPRAKEKARVKKRERELGQRRERAISEHREEAEIRTRQAEQAEHRARIAEQEARRERAEAQLRDEHAALHERGMADHELIAEDERDRFAGTSAVSDEQAVGAESEDGVPQTSAYEEGRRAAHEPERDAEFQRGRSEELEGDGESKGLLGKLRGRG
jgi:ABC-type multidrug transport system fused ATPase/permease subunit